jgi:catechol 2,3-dioxygenase-like lactoylglutathione lyase family enzyme
MKLTEIAFFSDDVKRMAAFYRRLLGTDPVAQSDGMAIFMMGQTKLFIHRNYTPEEGELPPESHFAFTVGDVDGACETLEGQGLTIELPPKTYYWGRSAYLRDPDGHMIELIEAPQDGPEQAL